MAYGFTSEGIAMTHLRQRMTEDMQLRGLALAKVQAYLRYVEQLSVFTGKSPDLATDEDFRQFFLSLHKQRVLPFLMNGFIYDDDRTYLLLKDGKADLAANKPEWKEGLSYIKSLSDAGLIDPGAFTQNAEALKKIG